MEDWKGGVASVHEKWWLVGEDERERREWYENLQKEMAEFYERREQRGEGW